MINLFEAFANVRRVVKWNCLWASDDTMEKLGNNAN